MKLINKLRRHRLMFLSVVLFLAVFGLIPAGIPDIAYALTQDNDGTYQLSSREDIFEMVDIITGSSRNSGEYVGNGHYGDAPQTGANFRMTQDIDMVATGNNNTNAP